MVRMSASGDEVEGGAVQAEGAEVGGEEEGVARRWTF